MTPAESAERRREHRQLLAATVVAGAMANNVVDIAAAVDDIEDTADWAVEMADAILLRTRRPA